MQTYPTRSRRSRLNPYCIQGDIAFLGLTDRKGVIIAEAVIDAIDLDRVQAAGRWSPRWNPAMQGYYVGSNHLDTYLHRFVMDANPGETIDHKNGATTDCRRQNLRSCTQRTNTANRTREATRKPGGFRNVTWDKKQRKWRVELRNLGKKILVGRYTDHDEAVAVARRAQAEYFDLPSDCTPTPIRTATWVHPSSLT